MVVMNEAAVLIDTKTEAQGSEAGLKLDRTTTDPEADTIHQREGLAVKDETKNEIIEITEGFEKNNPAVNRRLLVLKVLCNSCMSLNISAILNIKLNKE